jgi:nucleotide-binding universal stress UspA family protein
LRLSRINAGIEITNFLPRHTIGKEVTPMLTTNRIICPTDFSEASFKGLEKAIDIVRDGKPDNAEVELCVVHVEPPDESISAMVDFARHAQTSASRRAEAIKNLCAILENNVPSWIKSRPILRQGDAAEEVIRCSAEEGAGLIVLTAHGASGFQEGPIGRVAAAIMEQARCPVLLLPPAMMREKSVTCNGQCNGSCREMKNMRAALLETTSKTLFLDGD